MKTIVFNNKNTLVGINSTLDTAEEKISVREDEKWKKKRISEGWKYKTYEVMAGIVLNWRKTISLHTDPRSLMNPRHEKHEENYAKAYHNQNA